MRRIPATAPSGSQQKKSPARAWTWTILSSQITSVARFVIQLVAVPVQAYVQAHVHVEVQVRVFKQCRLSWRHVCLSPHREPVAD
jgi:hypothetical protein